MHGVVAECHLSMAKLLLKKHADTEVKTRSSGATALHFAAKKAFVKIVNLLLRKGAKIHATSWKGETPLHCAPNNIQSTAPEDDNGRDIIAQEPPDELYDPDDGSEVETDEANELHRDMSPTHVEAEENLNEDYNENILEVIKRLWPRRCEVTQKEELVRVAYRARDDVT